MMAMLMLIFPNDLKMTMNSQQRKGCLMIVVPKRIFLPLNRYGLSNI